MSANHGIMITGGTQTVGQMVAGAHARARQTTGGDIAGGAGAQQELAQRLEELIEALQRHADSLPDAADLVSDARRVKAEAAKPEPDKTKLWSLLRILENGTKGLASVATIVGSVKTLATGLFGLAP